MEYDINVGHVRKMQKNIWDSIKDTFGFREGYGEPVPIFGHYGGVFKCGSEQLVIHTDGVGTKLLLAQKLGRYDTIGIDAIAMSANDILCLGAEPLVGVDYIGLAKEDDELVSMIMKGLVEGSRQSRCAILGGETAIIPEIIKGGKKPFDLAFTMVGRVKKLIIGNDIEPGDAIVGLESSGLHSNGYTLARKVLSFNEWGKEMLKPTRIYVEPVLEMINACDIHGIAHITGGSFSKISRLNREVGYKLTDLPEPKPIFKELAKSVDNIEMHRTFNMGIGMVIILPKDRTGTILNIAMKHGLDASIIGEVTAKKGIWIKNGTEEADISL